MIPKLSIHWRKKQAKRVEVRNRKLDRALKNYSVAFEKIKEKTGMIAMNCYHRKLPKVTLIDWQNQKHIVDLTGIAFIIQRKAVPVSKKLEFASNPESVIFLLREFIEKQVKCGFVDIEPKFVSENYGFVDDVPVYIDLGRIEYREEVRKNPEAEIQRMRRHLDKWAKKPS